MRQKDGFCHQVYPTQLCMSWSSQVASPQHAVAMAHARCSLLALVMLYKFSMHHGARDCAVGFQKVMQLARQVYKIALLFSSVWLKAQHASGTIFGTNSMLVLVMHMLQVHCLVVLLMCHHEDSTTVFQFVQVKANSHNGCLSKSASAQFWLSSNHC